MSASRRPWRSTPNHSPTHSANIPATHGPNRSVGTTLCGLRSWPAGLSRPSPSRERGKKKPASRANKTVRRSRPLCDHSLAPRVSSHHSQWLPPIPRPFISLPPRLPPPFAVLSHHVRPKPCCTHLNAYEGKRGGRGAEGIGRRAGSRLSARSAQKLVVPFSLFSPRIGETLPKHRRPPSGNSHMSLV